MDKKNLIYFFVSSAFIFLIIYGGFVYNIYIHPTEIIDQEGNRQIILFGDFKYLFKIINCNNLGFDVYSSNDCYSDYYGSFLYGPSAWDEVLRIEAEQRRIRKEAAYRKQEFIDNCINWVVGLVCFALGAAVLGGGIYALGKMRDRW